MTDQLRRDRAAHGPRLVIPEGWLIDEIARDHMAHWLDRAPAHVVGVAAEGGALPPGASYRVYAEWRSLEAASEAVEQDTSSIRGAVLVRPGVEFQAGTDLVEVGGGPLLADPGAHVHDPWRSVGPLVVASELGRPPFPRRPVVVFVATEADDELAEWARRLVNRLVRLDVEARLALPCLAEGMHLTQPCLPCEESIRALAPDVVVALDEEAAAHVPSWCGTDRSTVVIELDRDVSMTTQLVSWQIGRASERLRARISRRVDAPRLAGLVRRLCAGPHVMPPSDGAGAERETAPVAFPAPMDDRARMQPTRSVVVLDGRPGGSASSRVEGLCDHLAAAGVMVTVAPRDGQVPASAHRVDLLILAGVHGSDTIQDLVVARRDVGRASVVDVDPSDLEVESTAADVPAFLSPPVADLVEACGLATSAGGAMHAAVSGLGVRSHVLPTLLSRTRAAALREARSIVGFEKRSDTVIGWHVGPVAAPLPMNLDEVTEALSCILDDRPEVIVEVVGDPERVPGALRRHDRLTVASGELEPATLTRWTVHLWTPPIIAGEVVDDLSGLVEVDCAGVPSVLSAASREAIEGYVAPDLVVMDAERPDEWGTALYALLDDDQLRAQRSRERFFQSGTVEGSVASKAVVNRFLGWARYEEQVT